EGGKHGLLYKPGSSKDAAAKVLQLLHDAEARKHLGNQARQRVLAEFSPQAALPHLIRALETAVSSA
ncbi:MAG: glycosyltransferase, partial [Anaerolineales bacterium]